MWKEQGPSVKNISYSLCHAKGENWQLKRRLEHQPLKHLLKIRLYSSNPDYLSGPEFGLEFWPWTYHTIVSRCSKSNRVETRDAPKADLRFVCCVE